MVLGGLAVWTEVDKLNERRTIAGDEKETQHGTFEQIAKQAARSAQH
jgi:hypothetical protein